MDQHTFDRLTRAVATGQSRRVFLRRLFGTGAALAVAGTTIEPTLAAPATATPKPEDEICLAPLVESDCGCLDASQTCCKDAICTGACTAKDGCCNVSTDKTIAARGEICGDHCCHPHLDPGNASYSECCDQSCCAGHCYGEDLCCPVDLFCPGLNADICCSQGQRCCGAGTDANTCIAAGDGSCCGIDECTATAGACYVGCEAGFCYQHVCDTGAVCCGDGTGAVSCIGGDCCADADCGDGYACIGQYCTAVECFTDADCPVEDACTIATCAAGACSYVAACSGECATCLDGVCSTDDTLCAPCNSCDAGACIAVICPDGFSCYEGTGECLGIA